MLPRISSEPPTRLVSLVEMNRQQPWVVPDIHQLKMHCIATGSGVGPVRYSVWAYMVVPPRIDKHHHFDMKTYGNQQY